MEICVDWDEKYPFPFVSLLKSLIDSKIKVKDLHKGEWVLKTRNDVLKMTWNDFYNIPDDKYEWIIKVFNELEKVEEYLSNIEDLKLKAIKE